MNGPCPWTLNAAKRFTDAVNHNRFKQRVILGFLPMFLYQLRDLQLAALTPWHLAARSCAQTLRAGLAVPFPGSEWLRTLAASATLLERNTRRYDRPTFDIKTTKFRGEPLEVKETVVDASTFCRLVHFERVSDHPDLTSHAGRDPKVLIVTPLSGHFATLMRGTVEAMLPSHNVYITDWVDAKMIPAAMGSFDLEDQIELLMRLIRLLGPDVHIIAISQASVCVLSAIALLAKAEVPMEPRSMTLIGGPVEARRAYCLQQETALGRPLSWYRDNQIQMVPVGYPGAFRSVYPGFMQLEDRMAMTLDRHLDEQAKYFKHLVRGDDDAAEVHEKFYDEFLAVMDVPAELYLQYVERFYQRCELADGTMTFRGQKIDLSAIRKTALLTVEGELDDLSPPGQTMAAHDLCLNLPAKMKQAHLEIGTGHYGVFSGRKWRNNIQPIIHKFIRVHSLAVEEGPEPA